MTYEILNALAIVSSVAAGAAILGIVGFAIYAEFFDGARFSSRDYLTDEEMAMIERDEENTTRP
jgi:hypothetical protein